VLNEHNTVFAQSGSLGDRPTDRPTDHTNRSVTIGAPWSGEVEKPNSVIVYGYNKLEQVFIGAVDSNTQCMPFLCKRLPDGATRN